MLRPSPFFAIAVLACLPSVALGAGKSVDEATAAEKAEASNAFTAAMANFDHGDFKQALAGFKASYDEVRSPNSHFMIARTMAKLGQNPEAYAELEAVVTEADALNGRYADTSTAAHAKMDEILPRIGLLVVTLENAPKGTDVLVGNDRVDPAQLGQPLPELPGATIVTAVTPTGASYPHKVTLVAGDKTTLPIDIAADAAAAAPAAPKTSPRTHYRVEIEGHVMGETLGPQSATRGAGFGALAALELLHTGVFGLGDSFAVAAGLDWSATSTDPHFWIPVLAQWNVWLFPALSFRLEPGVAMLTGAGTRVTPALYAGLRYQVYKRLCITGRVGIPGATIGASLLL